MNQTIKHSRFSPFVEYNSDYSIDLLKYEQSPSGQHTPRENTIHTKAWSHSMNKATSKDFSNENLYSEDFAKGKVKKPHRDSNRDPKIKMLT